MTPPKHQPPRTPTSLATEDTEDTEIAWDLDALRDPQNAHPLCTVQTINSTQKTFGVFGVFGGDTFCGFGVFGGEQLLWLRWRLQQTALPAL